MEKNIGIKKRARSLSVSWQGRKLGLSKKQDAAFAGTKSFDIPAKDEFSIIDINTSKKNTILFVIIAAHRRYSSFSC